MAAQKDQLAMPCCHCPPIPLAEDPGDALIAEAPAQYRPRHPERTEFYRLFEEHFDGYVRCYEERFALRSGATRLILDPLEWIHRITTHIPDPGNHCQRFYGAYSNCGRVVFANAAGDSADPGGQADEARDNSDFSREARSTWARSVRKIFEADPLTCACGGRMRIISFITNPRVIDRILRHRQSGRCKTADPFEPRPPPRCCPHAVQ
jgi:hypothetical protein